MIALVILPILTLPDAQNPLLPMGAFVLVVGAALLACK